MNVTDTFPGAQFIEGRLDQCRGKHSIQKEINMLAKQYSDWSKRIQSHTWREEVRKKLLKLDKKWCDYKTGVCACKEEK